MKKQKKLALITIVFLLLASCSTLMPIAGAAGGGAIGSAVAGPGGAAIGAVGGVMAGELLNEDSPLTPAVQPEGQIASTVHETTSLIETVGLWYLLIFVFLPLLTSKGRGWLKNLTRLHDNVNKKDLSEYDGRLNKLEDMLSSKE